MLNLLEQRRPACLLAGDFKLHQNVLARGVTQHRVDVALKDLQRLGLLFAAINDRRNDSARFQFPGSRTPCRVPRFCFQFNLLGHGSYLSFSILNSDDTDSSLWIRFIPSPRSSATLSTVTLNPSTERTGVLLVVINSSILDFCNRPMATSTRTAWDTPA